MSEEPARIEHFPDELFFSLFSFTHPKDLLRGWLNLNSCLNAILRSIPISIEIKKNEDLDNNLLYLQHFASQMVSLKDTRLIPRTRVDVRSLTNIQYLCLMHCSKEQLEDIHPSNQPYLTRFYSLSSSLSGYERILFGEDRFSNLISFGAPKGATIQLLNLTNPINRTLRYFYLYSASNETICQFLHYLPNLISLHINYFYASHSTSTRPSTKSCIERLTIKHILSSQSDFNELLLSDQFPSLTQLSVVLNACEFDQLAHVLTKLLYLKHIDVKIKTYPKNLDLDRIRRQSPCKSINKLTRQIGANVSFIDVFIKNKNGILATSVYRKEATEPYIVPFKSDHPRHVFSNIIDGALMRAIRYSSTLSAFNAEQCSIKLMLLYNGYLSRFIYSRFMKFLTNRPTDIERLIASRTATVMDLQHQDTIDNPLVIARLNKNSKWTNCLIIHYEHEASLTSYKKDIHQLWNQIFKETIVMNTKLIVGNRNSANAKKTLVRRRPHHKSKRIMINNTHQS